MSIAQHFTSFASKAAFGALAIAASLPSISAAQAETAGGFRRSVEANIEHKLALPGREAGKGIATVAVTVDSQGKVQSAQLVKSSGHAIFDREALRTAHAVQYPSTGHNRTVAMVLGFNQAVSAADRSRSERLVTAWRDDQRVRLAKSDATTQPDS